MIIRLCEKSFAAKFLHCNFCKKISAKVSTLRRKMLIKGEESYLAKKITRENACNDTIFSIFHS